MFVETPSHLLVVSAAVPLRLTPCAFAVVSDRRPTMSAPLFPGCRLPPLPGPCCDLPQPAVHSRMRVHTMRDLDRLRDDAMAHGAHALAKLGRRIQGEKPLALLPGAAANVSELHAAQVQKGLGDIFFFPCDWIFLGRVKPRDGVHHAIFIPTPVARVLGHPDDGGLHARFDECLLDDAEGVDGRDVRGGCVFCPRRLRPMPDAQGSKGRKALEEILQQRHAGEARVVAARSVEVCLELFGGGEAQWVVRGETGRWEDVEGGVRLCCAIHILWRLGVESDKSLVILELNGQGDLG